MTSEGKILAGFASIVVILLFTSGSFAVFFIPHSSAESTRLTIFASSNSITSSKTLTSPNAQILGYFGDSIATSGNFVVVGAPQEQAKGVCGVAYIFSGLKSAERIRTLTNPNGGPCDTCCPPLFGSSVAISGTTVVIGATGLTGENAAYIFNATTGALIGTLNSPQTAKAAFAASVAIDGNILVVGAPYANANGHDYVGAAYVYNASTSKLIEKLVSPHPQLDGQFGASVAISGKNVLVGAPDETENKIYLAGSAHVFDVTTGALIKTLTSPNAQPTGGFGSSVAISGKTMMVGAPFENTGKNEQAAGHAYIFAGLETAKLITTLTSPNAQPDGTFGDSVALSGGIVLIGASSENAKGFESAGHAYTFNVGTGSLIKTLTSPDAQFIGGFGSSVAISDKALVVGAPSENANGLDSAGHAYLFF